MGTKKRHDTPIARIYIVSSAKASDAIRAHTVKGKNLIKLDIVYLTLSQYIANMDEQGL